MQPLNPHTIPLKGTFLIEAGAGTGKTYTLTLLYLRLILERQLKVDEILVVTFTRAATDELRTRIRRRLRDTLEALDAVEQAEKDITLLIKDLDPEQARRNLLDALAQLDEAAIFTIHGFCRRILEDNAFETGVPFEADFIESEQQLRLQIMEDFWRQRFYPQGKEMSAWVAATWESPEGLLNTINGALAVHGAELTPRIQEDRLVELETTCNHRFEETKTLWLNHREDITDILTNDPCLTRNQKTYRLKDRVPELIQAMDTLVTDDTLPYNAPKSLALLKQSSLDENLKKKCAAQPSHPFFVAFELFHDGFQEYLHSLKINILQEALNYLGRELTGRKAQASALSFDDLLLKLSRALDEPVSGQKLGSRIGARYPAALVDEFQDTDPLQYRILSAVYREGNKVVYMIGDPKQAIYSFRGADIFTYLQARRNTPKAHRYSLDTNYRSTAAMVEAVNTLFDRQNAFLFEPGIAFHPVKAAAPADDHPLLIDAEPVNPVNALLLSAIQDTPTAKGRLNIADASQAAAAFTAAQIAELLDKGRQGHALLEQKPVEAGDIAVLVRTHGEAESIRRALTSLAVNSVYYSRESVFNTSEAKDLFRLLTALLDLTDTQAARTALATDCFGMDGNRIAALNQDTDGWEQLLNTLYGYRRLWKEQGVMVMLQQLFAEQKVVRRLTAQYGGERKLTNYLHLAELLQNSAATDHGGAGLLRWFAQQRHAPDQEAEHLQVRLESDEHLVKIVTIHKSKGLEYPIVFLPFLWRTRRTDTEGMQIFHDRSTMEPVIDLGSGHREHAALAEQEVLAEQIRLLYVALTRARCCCFFCWGMISSIERSALARFLHNCPERPFPANDGELLAELDRFNRRKNIIKLVTTYSRPSRPDVDAGKRLAPTVRTFTGSVNRGRPITSYSQLTAGHTAMPHKAVPREPDQREADHSTMDAFTFPRGASAGTCIHEILERINFSTAGDQWLPDIGEALSRSGIDLEWEPRLADWLRSILSVKLPLSCALQDLNPEERINELSFLFPLEQKDTRRLNRLLRRWGYEPLDMGPAALEGMMKGFVDLVFRHENRYFIADYKSNYLGPDHTCYIGPTLEQAVSNHRYDLQYLIYTTALHRYLRSRLPDYSYEAHFGGVYYLFLRGMHPDYPEGSGIFFTRPEERFIDDLDTCFQGGEA